MDTGQVVLTLAVIVAFAVALVVAAFLDRRRGREIEHDRSRVPHPREEARWRES